MIRRASAAALLALGIAAAAASSAASDPPSAVSSYYLARADARLCPSPMCGGIWLRLVNKQTTTCGDGTRHSECYAAEADLGQVLIDEKGRARLQRLVTEGRALARGKLVRNRVPGFPELDVLVVSEVWPASSSRRPATGTFRGLRDNGVRCITSPCFSMHAAVLNDGRHVNVSGVRLSGTGAPARERRRASAQLAVNGLIAAGRVVTVRNAGPGGDGRVLAASQFYVRAGR